jgi:hypothetical protein
MGECERKKQTKQAGGRDFDTREEAREEGRDKRKYEQVTSLQEAKLVLFILICSTFVAPLHHHSSIQPAFVIASHRVEMSSGQHREDSVFACAK